MTPDEAQVDLIAKYLGQSCPEPQPLRLVAEPAVTLRALRLAAVLLQQTATPAAGMTLVELERAAILAALERAGWVQAAAARELGITERVILYKIRLHGIDVRQIRRERLAAA